MSRWRNTLNSRGFTLIELLVVIAIIGLLASIVLASLSSARTKAQDAGRVATLQELQKALELYNVQNNAYPVSINSTWASQCAGWGTVAANNVIPGIVPTYMPSMPADPTMNVSASNNCIIYASNGVDYKLLDYRFQNTSNLTQTQMLPFIDPNRNYGQAWAHNTVGCTSQEVTPTIAIWTPGAICW